MAPNRNSMMSHLVRTRERPEPKMDYYDYIKSSKRLAALEANRMPDFASMKSVDLRKAMQVRRMPQTGTKAFMIGELEEHFRIMLDRHEDEPLFQYQRFLRERPGLMLASKVKAEPSRPSFMDLPGELRNVIYELALFDLPSKTSSDEKLEATGDYHHAGVLTMVSRNGHVFLPHSGRHPVHLRAAEFRIDRTISVLHVVGALNKEIRKEVQTFFWARTSIRLENPSLEYTCVTIRQFLNKIGHLGRSALAGLDVNLTRADYRYRDYQAMISLLRECKNLRDLALYLPISTIFGPVDRDALEKFFLQGQSLNSPSVNDLVDALHSMPQLSNVCLRLVLPAGYKYPYVHLFGIDDKFANFAFSGAREALLVQEVRTRLSARLEAHFEVGCNKEYTLDYKKWLGNSVEIGGEEELSE